MQDIKYYYLYLYFYLLFTGGVTSIGTLIGIDTPPTVNTYIILSTKAKGIGYTVYLFL